MQTTKQRLNAACVVIAAALATGGCSFNLFEAEETEAVRDFIYANDLEEVEQIRFFQNYTYTYVNDNYVTIPTNSGDYLVEFTRTCPELRQMHFTSEMVDYRDDNRNLRARFDTIRGCRIGKIYQISEEQMDELSALGDAPGEESYLPEDDDS
jgi:Family of unknown function (DUF6491)